MKQRRVYVTVALDIAPWMYNELARYAPDDPTLPELSRRIEAALRDAIVFDDAITVGRCEVSELPT